MANDPKNPVRLGYELATTGKAKGYGDTKGPPTTKVTYAKGGKVRKPHGRGR